MQIFFCHVAFESIPVLTLKVGGDFACTFSERYFSMKKVSGGPNFLDFSRLIMNFQEIYAWNQFLNR